MTVRRPADGPREVDADDDRPHPDAGVEEWVFTAWLPGGAAGLITAYRRPAATPGWYWSALARRDEPVLHVGEWDVPPRTDPLLVKAHGLWADHVCERPMQQWTVVNETFAVALDDPTEALGRGYGTPSAMAFDLEWYAAGAAQRCVDGYAQDGVVHGLVELGRGPLTLVEAPARRWHRWGPRSLASLDLPEAYAHTGVRAVFAFPDGTVADWLLTPDGWRRRPDGGAAPPGGPAARG
ncbi:MAG: hypothetical protein ACRDZ2_09500 [Ilumatobacteraceae bacterium]